VLLIAEIVIGGWGAIVCGLLAAALFALLWFAVPIRHRMRVPAGDRED
jgi:hypothetical protein